MRNVTNNQYSALVLIENDTMKITDFDTPNYQPDDDDMNDPANQEDYPANVGEEPGSSGDDFDNEDTNEEWDDLTDNEDINENEDGNRSDRSANDVDGNGGYPDDEDALNSGS
jgi:hypothetical protein